ncbi:MAG: murein biosynthesis integral membrane protein MurJ [Desulfuromonas sp.]|nr:MAG: murein biosynthesis integral membrane protein MurJ [Desulfuromonas sp.]
MALATLTSRIAGLVRDMVVGRIFGAGYITDAFFMAFTIPNLLRRFFAEGSMTAAFVPTFSEVYRLEGEQEARRVFSICWTLLLLVMLVICILGILGSPWIVRSIAAGFDDIPGKLALTNSLNQVMFPYILLVSLLALLAGVLNVYGHFFLPALSPLMLNLALIAAALTAHSFLDVPIMALAYGVLLGGVLQLLILYPALKRYRIRPRLNFTFSHPRVRTIARLMLPGVAGVAIYQVNVIVTRVLASFLPEGSVSFLYYGQRLFEFPQGVFIVALAQAVLPTMSRQAGAVEVDELKESFNFAQRLILFGTLPAACGLVLCAGPIYSLFFMGGAFDAHAVHQSSLALAAYAPGLLFVGISRVTVPVFYAHKDTRTPVWISFWTLLVNAVGGVLLMQFWAHIGLALALTFSSAFNAVLLLIFLQRRIRVLELRALLVYLLKLLPVVAVMSLVVKLLLSHGEWLTGGSRWENGAWLLTATLVGVVVYLVGAWLLRVPELEQAVGILRRKIRKEPAGG